MKINGFIFILSLVTSMVFAGNLLDSKVLILTGNKTSNYMAEGIFSNGKGEIAKSELKAIRHAYTDEQGYERLVFDFSTEVLPQVYGNFSGKEKKIYLDLFNTTLNSKIDSFGNSKFVNELDLFPITSESLSLEITLKEQLSVDVFYLQNPARLV